MIQKSWQLVLKRFTRASPQGSPYLSKSTVYSLDNHTLILHFTDSFACDRIQKNEKGRLLAEKTINETLSVSGYKIKCLYMPNAMPAHSSQATETVEDHPSLMEVTAPEAESKPASIADFDLAESDPQAINPTPTAAAQTPLSNAGIGPFTKSVLDIFDGEIVQ